MMDLYQLKKLSVRLKDQKIEAKLVEEIITTADAKIVTALKNLRGVPEFDLLYRSDCIPSRKSVP
ncbi:MAG: hypothetical protein NTV84_09250, partial [Methanoregula sp.]|nr:hypothetical protein [Methanoregula sp.]